MTNEERDLIQGFVQRACGGPPALTAGSVPATTSPSLPPIDREADALIGDLFTRYPDARYRITQMAFIQEHALAEAQNQISQLQWQIQNLRQQQAAAPPPQTSPWGAAAAAPAASSGGLFGGLFGGRAQAAPPPPQPQYAPPPQPQYMPPPQPQYAPGYQPGMFQQRGSGFLGSALTTAAGVAGGMVAGNALMNLFSGNHGGGFGGGGFGGGGFGGGFGAPGAVEYVPVAPAAASPWAAPATDGYDAGGLPKDPGGWSGQDQSSGWSTPQDAGPQDSGWQDASADPSGSDGGGWTDVDNS